MDSDPVRRQGPERDNAEGEVVLGASPPARLILRRAGGNTAAPAKPARPPNGVASDGSAALLQPRWLQLLYRLEGRNRPGGLRGYSGGDQRVRADRAELLPRVPQAAARLRDRRCE